MMLTVADAGKIVALIEDGRSQRMCEVSGNTPHYHLRCLETVPGNRYIHETNRIWKKKSYNSS
jgi:hypothetical protein